MEHGFKRLSERRKKIVRFMDKAASRDVELEQHLLHGRDTLASLPDCPFLDHHPTTARQGFEQGADLVRPIGIQAEKTRELFGRLSPRPRAERQQGNRDAERREERVAGPGKLRSQAPPESIDTLHHAGCARLHDITPCLPARPPTRPPFPPAPAAHRPPCGPSASACRTRGRLPRSRAAWRVSRDPPRPASRD